MIQSLNGSIPRLTSSAPTPNLVYSKAMKVLVIGSGGREHALVWKMRQSPRVSQIYCAPGNAGIAAEAECLPADVKNVESLLALAAQIKPDLTVVGPELPLQLARPGLRHNWNPAKVSQRSSCSAITSRRPPMPFAIRREM
jgi:phosphoribosylamine--glycine ligase